MGAVAAILGLLFIVLTVGVVWLLVLDDDTRSRLVTETGTSAEWKDPQAILVQGGIGAAWLASAIVCFLKGKPLIPILSFIAAILSDVPIGGMYWHHIVTEPLTWLPFLSAVRLGRPDSIWSHWFYRREKLTRSILIYISALSEIAAAQANQRL